MAAVATIDSDGRSVSGDTYVRRGTLNLNTYAATGIAVTPGTFGLNVTILDLNIEPANGYIPRYDKTNKKVMVYLQKDPGAAGGADIPLPEAGSIDLSAVAFRFRAEGK